MGMLESWNDVGDQVDRMAELMAIVRAAEGAGRPVPMRIAAEMRQHLDRLRELLPVVQPGSASEPAGDLPSTLAECLFKDGESPLDRR